ncbi:putative RNA METHYLTRANSFERASE [Vibrio nigripulchritudo MADA3029]|uniref:tRNA1(Val) (adenine(37)-N6)-methyltransferase n=1 Tax=Vibrio nigripulchritudo TaxID=28173 RepID=UPI0003B1A2A9|nr:methyltransferase [Vibrio nigripulchritudo]CCN48035.1 putative RNA METHYLTRANSFERASE [Vibrio nigripulchritudo MADA3020]CCN53093.1 putative RNA METHYLTRANSFERASE [Vibrio nigripulchritudo MADA3021]CCN57861.1 putative RNA METHYLTRANSFERASE [Vibrio nigripulchritudo MADA3029]
MKNRTKDFQFKQFKIRGGRSGMPVSTDGVLLGAWASISPAGQLLDIGTGTGLLSLMCAQRSDDNLVITAVELEQDAFETASLNFADSPWSQRIRPVCGDILNLSFDTQFDAIICNPPYFNSGEQALDTRRADARHTNTLTHSALMKTCWAHLTDTGAASFVLPLVEGEQCIEIARAQGWHLSQCCRVQTTARKPATRLLFTLTKQPCETQESSLVINQGNGYSSEFIALSQDFYLKM